MGNLIIRRSKVVRDLFLTSNTEKVYRVYLFGQEMMNGLEYDKVSDYFNALEKEHAV
jgi:hypothetical protein